MAQQKQQQYDDALGSIFDFIFEQSQKPPHKVKPTKVTGIDGTSEFTDALMAAVENPLLHINDATMGAFNEGLDIDLAHVSTGDRGGGVKLNLQDLGEIVKDPGKFIDSKFRTAEAIRKMQRYAHTGEMMGAVVAGTWATKKGIDFDTRKAMMGMSMGVKSDQKGATRPDAFSHDLMSRADKLMEKHFIDGERSFNQGQLIARYGSKKGKELYDMYAKARKAYESGDARERARIYTGKDKGFDLAKMYSVLEADEIRGKASLETDLDKRKDYVAAARFVDNMATINDIKNYQKESKKSMDFHRQKIEELKRQGAPGSEIAKHRSRIRELRKDYSIASRYELVSKLGKLEGNYYTAKELFVDGNLLPNIINGKFFDDRYNKIEWLQPSESFEREVFGTVGFGKGKKFKDEKVAFHKAKTGGDRFANSYYEGMNSLYYMSPATWVKSLATGEIFAYRAYVVEKVFKKKMEEVLSQSIEGFNMDNFLKGVLNGNGQDYLDLWEGNVSDEVFRKIKNFVMKEERLNKLAYQFSAIARARDRIKKYIEENIAKELRDTVGNQLLKVAFIKKFGETAVNTWMEKGGLYGLAKGLIVAGLQAIGFTVAGPLGNFVVGLLSLIATSVVIKLAKPVLKFGVQIVILVVIGFLGLGVMGYGAFHLLVFSQYSHVVPNQIVQCPAYHSLGLLPVDEPFGPGDPDWPGPGGELPPFTPGNLPPGQECLFSHGPNLRCTQGPFSYCSKDPEYINHYRPSHINSPAVDVAVGGNFHAPTFCNLAQGNCKVLATGQGTCGGANKYPAGGYVMFEATHAGRTYQFHILHVAIGVSTGQSLYSGQPVASIVDSPDWRMCSSGLHGHLTAKVNGSYNTQAIMNQDFNCNIGYCERDQCWPR